MVLAAMLRRSRRVLPPHGRRVRWSASTAEAELENTTAREYLYEGGLFVLRWFQLIGLIHCVQEYGIDFSTTIGASMVPTCNESGDVLIFERITQRFQGWTRGEVVVATSPKDPAARICKRIIGLPGDRVTLREDSPWADSKDVLIPRGHVWLVGDNRQASYDSRHYGPVPLGLLQGKVKAKLWPLSEVGWMSIRLPDCYKVEPGQKPNQFLLWE